MRNRFSLLLAFALVFALAARGQANDDARAIIDKAIKAHGGEERLAKFKDAAIESKAKGTVNALGNQLDFTLETYVQMPDKLKTVMHLTLNGMNYTTTQVFNGDKFFLNVNGMSLDNLLDDKAKEEVKEQLYSEGLARLAFFKDKSVELAPLGEIKVEGKDAVGIRLSSKGHRDASLYFDKTTGLLVKIENRIVDFTTKQEKMQTKILLDYKVEDGFPRPTRVIVNHDDQKLMEAEITEVKVTEKFDESVFAKP